MVLTKYGRPQLCLGANEAPPAIISVCLGEQLTDIFEQIGRDEAKTSREPGYLNFGVDISPAIPRDASKRTSPLAFTGINSPAAAPGSPYPARRSLCLPSWRHRCTTSPLNWSKESRELRETE